MEAEPLPRGHKVLPLPSAPPACGRRKGTRGEVSVKSRCRTRLRIRLKVKNSRGIFKVCCTVHKGHKRPKRGCYQRCEHPVAYPSALMAAVLPPVLGPVMVTTRVRRSMRMSIGTGSIPVPLIPLCVTIGPMA
eukprot:6739179-Pyramimonas_sp.AAC.1